MAHLQIQNAHKSFGDIHVLKGIDLSVEKGEMTCLIGASGSGKSTLLRTLNLLDPLDDGTIHLNRTDISTPGLDPQPIRQKIGIVFQSFNLFPHMTALENVMLAPRRTTGKSRAKLLPEIENLFSRFALADRMQNYPDQLSGGQQQRIAIIRALAMKPEIMLFDEITSALDPELEQEVIKVIKDLAAEGRTMMIVTHDMKLAADVSDHVVFLHQGLIEEQGAPKDLFGAPKSERLQGFLSATQPA